MIRPKLSETQFDNVARYIGKHDIELVVSDFNGVLDNYYGTKYKFLEGVLGSEYRDKHFARLALRTDTAYIQNRNTTLEETVTEYYRDNAMTMSSDSKELFESGPDKSVITPEAKRFLGALTVPTVIFTAQNPEKIYQSVEREFLEGLHIGVKGSVVKPSIESLTEVLSEQGISANHTCMIGDGMIDDMLPAKLLGMHTVLISPFADIHISE